MCIKDGIKLKVILDCIKLLIAVLFIDDLQLLNKEIVKKKFKY